VRRVDRIFMIAASLIVSNVLPGAEGAPLASLARASASSQGIEGLVLRGGLPGHEKLHADTWLRIIVSYRTSVSGEIADLYLKGIDSWKIIPPVPPGNPHYNDAGSCVVGTDDVPFILHEEISQRTYVEVPSHCVVLLHLVPRAPGRNVVTVTVYHRIILTKKGALGADAYMHPHAINRKTLIRGVKLQRIVWVHR
jgi:hypothetical protein